MAMGMYYHAEYTIQETTCPNDKETSADNHCPLLECEFSVSLDKFRSKHDDTRLEG